MGENSKSYFAHQMHSNKLYSCYFEILLMIQVKVLTSDLCKGHWPHLEAISGLESFSANNFWLKRDTDVRMVPFCSSRRHIDWYATWPIWVISWPWPEAKIWPWSFEGKKYMFLFVSTRETRWNHRQFSIFLSSKVIREKRFSPNTAIFNFLDH